MLPEGKPLGAVVCSHGLTDSPYSLRHLSHVSRRRLRGRRAAPAGHGTVPGGCTPSSGRSGPRRRGWRYAGRRLTPPAPLHVIGFSNGGALAMKYSLDALDDKALARPDRIVLVSPMIGITAMGALRRRDGLAGGAAAAYAKAAWLGIVPEFNPFKYSSFPVNGAPVLARRASSSNRSAITPGPGREARRAGARADLPVGRRLHGQHARDRQRAVPELPRQRQRAGALRHQPQHQDRPAAASNAGTILARLVPDAPRTYRLAIVTNENPNSAQVLERVTGPVRPPARAAARADLPAQCSRCRIWR